MPEENPPMEPSPTEIDAAVASDLADLTDVPLADLAAAVRVDQEPGETMRRVAPTDGTRLLVAASFNSAI